MSAAIPPPAWTEDALCAQVDPELFFPEHGASSSDARRVCLACPVREVCLEDALLNPEPHGGIRGGLSERERRKIARRAAA